MSKTPKPSLAETHPELAKELCGLDPKTLSKGSNRVVEWSCIKGHTFVSAVGNRVRGQGCGVCAGKQVLVGFNDLATLNFFKGVRAAIFIGTIAIVGFTGTYIGPEALRVSDPGIGTCWAKVDSNEYSPIACWSEESVYQTISVVSSDSSCPSNTDSVFPPDENDSQYHCLKNV